MFDEAVAFECLDIEREILFLLPVSVCDEHGELAGIFIESCGRGHIRHVVEVCILVLIVYRVRRNIVCLALHYGEDGFAPCILPPWR